MPPFRFSQHSFWRRSCPGYVAIFLSTLGVLALTNPDHHYYESYVTDALSDYLIEKVCHRFPEFTESCNRFVIEHEAELMEIVRDHTQRANFGLFSTYTTEIALPMIPAVKIHMLGITARFFPLDVQFPDGTNDI